MPTLQASPVVELLRPHRDRADVLVYGRRAQSCFRYRWSAIVAWRIRMTAFVKSLLALIAITVVAVVILNVLPMSSSEVYSLEESTRL